VTFEYDDYCYSTGSYAPEGGMGQSGVIYIYFSAENSEEYRSTGPMTGRYDIHSNNLTGAFSGHPALTRVELPDFLTTIGSAFGGCPNLKMVTMSPNMTEIGESAFDDSPIEIINIPETLEIIGHAAFSRTRITGDLNLPKLKYIGDGAFGNTKILSFVFNPGIEYIGKGAFSGTLLESVYMPNPPEVIRTNTFACDELKEAKFGEGLKRLEANIFGYNMPKKIELPQSLIELAAYALPDKYIQSITPEDGIRYVGGVAYQVAEERDEYTIKAGTKSLAEELFQWNSSVKKVTVPNSVTIVGKRAFARSGIESIPTMEGVTEWPEELFDNCLNLARITIPENITKIDNNVFNYCSSLWQVKYNAIDADLSGFWGYRPSSVKVILGDKVERIPAGLFESNVTNTDLVLPKSVERIDTAAFVSNRNLRSIYLPDGIKVIEPETFRGCDNLEEVHMPLNLERISHSAFMQCESLKTISIPEGTKILEEYAFYGNYNASTLYLPSTLISIGGAAFYQLGSNTEVKITAASVDPLISDGAYKDILYGVETRDVVQIKVPNTSIEDYKNHPQWSRFAAVIVPIDEIAAKEESVSTSFETAAIDETTDLSDAVVGDIYVTVSEDSGDGYDATDGSIVLSSTMTDDDAEAIGGLAPGKSDLANRFNGLVVMVHEGKGTVTINCLTIGTKHVGVKIGDSEPASFKKDSKGDITVEYSVAEDTYVYVYAIETAPAADPAESPRRIKSRAADDCIKIYAITVAPTSLSGIEDLEAESNLSPVTDWYTIDGVKVENPSAKGIYVVKREDGTVSKIMIK
ncbi:MAG: leucine-rich repeat domain-containing protein, partial [Muribaculaceae bacterium]|nr:leucine-rich repeat domain-containing protein [Muribaculaceae bacterium]